MSLQEPDIADAPSKAGAPHRLPTPSVAVRSVQFAQDVLSSGEWKVPAAALCTVALVFTIATSGIFNAFATTPRPAHDTLAAIPVPDDAHQPFSPHAPLIAQGTHDATAIDAAELAVARELVPASPYTARFGAIADDERECLARAVYFEARGEPIDGQIAVAQVVLNRAASGRWPSTVCKVTSQGVERGEKCQFSYACWASSDRELTGDLWNKSRAIAERVLSGDAWLEPMLTATHYHRHDLRPVWRLALLPIQRIGLHVFYADRTVRISHAAVPRVRPAPALAATEAPAAAPAHAPTPRVAASRVETGSLPARERAPPVRAPAPQAHVAPAETNTAPATPAAAAAAAATLPAAAPRPVAKAPVAKPARPAASSTAWVGKLFD